jgi:hypothetical protein
LAPERSQVFAKAFLISGQKIDDRAWRRLAAFSRRTPLNFWATQKSPPLQ